MDATDDNTVKINVDAALFDDKRMYSFACVARDAAGEVIEAKSSRRVGQPLSEIAEAMGVHEALSWIKEKGWVRVIVESDCLNCIQSVRSNYTMVSYFGSVIEDCKTLLNELKSVSLKFIRRSTNQMAHALERDSYYVADRVLRGHISIMIFKM